VLLPGKTIRLLPDADGELRAADGVRPADPVGVQRYLASPDFSPNQVHWGSDSERIVL
jgi:hypothetical protein